MDITKRNKVIEWMFFAFLVLFPFGQILRVETNISGFIVPIHPIDIVAGLFLLLVVCGKIKTPTFHKYAKNFGYIILFSLIFSLSLFSFFKVFVGSFYFVRLIVYYSLFLVLWNQKMEKEKVLKSTVASLVFVAVFGWIQYFLYPNLIPLKEWGWDDHLLRMVGTFLDPTFTGILLTFGFLASISKYRALAIFFLISVALTYSRASYISLIGGASVLFLLKRQKYAFLVTTLLLLVAVFFIPKGIGEGLKLERLKSIYARLTNYQETIYIFQKSPIFGVGFDNLCFAKEKYLGEINLKSHACSGSDSSLILVLATTGVVGVLTFIKFLHAVSKEIEKNTYGHILIASSFALFIHSFFSNSLFYPWVMGWMAILLAISIKE